MSRLPTATIRVLLATLVTALAFGATAATAGAAKKKKKEGGGAVNITKAVNAPIPDAAPPPPGTLVAIFGTLTSTIDVGKQFKGRQVRDVNVTVQTLGATGLNPASGLIAFLTAPSGADSTLFSGLGGFGGTNPSIGPLTLDDESVLDLGSGAPDNPTQLFEPWAGTAAPGSTLSVMDGGPVRGTWTLTVQDGLAGETSSLVSWRLNVVAGRPFKTK
jgi:hypothetical protein